MSVDRLPDRKPPWLKVPLAGGGPVYLSVRGGLRRGGLHTVCEEARCPNRPQCWGQGTATFLLLGDVCTRHCRFCAVTSGQPGGSLDLAEPERVRAMARELGLRYVVLTSVDRDDLPDGGAAGFAATARALVDDAPDRVVEALVPDFGGQRQALATVLAAPVAVLGHNLETVERLTGQVRDRRASYAGSLAVLAAAKELAPERFTKSSLMLGLGETAADVRATLRDLRAVGCDLLTLGQYLRPARHNLPVVEYVPPAVFADHAREAESMGFLGVAAGPLVRSSYAAAELYAKARAPRGAATAAP